MTASVLVAQAPRESAGAATARAFDYQVHVSVAYILDRHAKPGPYFALFDHFDDFVLVEGDDNQSEASFYQVKSLLDGAWTAARLARRAAKGDLPRSIIGKAYYNLHQFGALVRRATIVSNQPLHAKFASGPAVSPDDGEIVLSSLCANDTSALLKALTADFSSALNPAHHDVLSFALSPLNLHSYAPPNSQVIVAIEEVGDDKPKGVEVKTFGEKQRQVLRDTDYDEVERIFAPYGRSIIEATRL